MLGRENTGAALGSGAVDDDFWALVCEDEEWLQAEFDAIVSGPCETLVRPSGRPNTIAAAWPGPGGGAAENIRNHQAVANREPTRQAVAAGTITSRMRPDYQRWTVVN